MNISGEISSVMYWRESINKWIKNRTQVSGCFCLNLQRKCPKLRWEIPFPNRVFLNKSPFLLILILHLEVILHYFKTLADCGVKSSCLKNCQIVLFSLLDFDISSLYAISWAFCLVNESHLLFLQLILNLYLIFALLICQRDFVLSFFDCNKTHVICKPEIVKSIAINKTLIIATLYTINTFGEMAYFCLKKDELSLLPFFL